MSESQVRNISSWITIRDEDIGNPSEFEVPPLLNTPTHDSGAPSSVPMAPTSHAPAYAVPEYMNPLTCGSPLSGLHLRRRRSSQYDFLDPTGSSHFTVFDLHGARSSLSSASSAPSCGQPVQTAQPTQQNQQHQLQQAVSSAVTAQEVQNAVQMQLQLIQMQHIMQQQQMLRQAQQQQQPQEQVPQKRPPGAVSCTVPVKTESPNGTTSAGLYSLSGTNVKSPEEMTIALDAEGSDGEQDNDEEEDENMVPVPGHGPSIPPRSNFVHTVQIKIPGASGPGNSSASSSNGSAHHLMAPSSSSSTTSSSSSTMSITAKIPTMLNADQQKWTQAEMTNVKRVTILSKTGRTTYHPWKGTDCDDPEDAEWYKTSVYTLCMRIELTEEVQLEEFEAEVMLLNDADLSIVADGLKMHKMGPFRVGRRSQAMYQGEIGPFQPSTYSFNHNGEHMRFRLSVVIRNMKSQQDCCIVSPSFLIKSKKPKKATAIANAMRDPRLAFSSLDRKRPSSPTGSEITDAEERSYKRQLLAQLMHSNAINSLVNSSSSVEELVLMQKMVQAAQLVQQMGMFNNGVPGSSSNGLPSGQSQPLTLMPTIPNMAANSSQSQQQPQSFTHNQYRPY